MKFFSFECGCAKEAFCVKKNGNPTGARWDDACNEAPAATQADQLDSAED